MSELLSAMIFVIFVVLLVVAATSTLIRYVAYRRDGIPAPRLLPRDRDVFLGLAIPFVLIAAARVFDWSPHILDAHGDAHLWWLLLTGIPPIYALARYCYFELFVIER